MQTMFSDKSVIESDNERETKKMCDEVKLFNSWNDVDDFRGFSEQDSVRYRSMTFLLGYYTDIQYIYFFRRLPAALQALIIKKKNI